MGRHGAAGVRGAVGTGPARARAGLQELRQAPDAAWQLEARGCGAATPRKRARAARPPPPSPARGASHIPPQPPETAVVLAARPPPVPPQPRPRRGPWLPSSAGGGRSVQASAPRSRTPPPQLLVHVSSASPGAHGGQGPARTVFFPVAVQPGPCAPRTASSLPQLLPLSSGSPRGEPPPTKSLSCCGPLRRSRPGDAETCLPGTWQPVKVGHGHAHR